MRKVRLISLVVAVAAHASLAAWKVSMERKAIKPLTTRFIKREPRLVKPLELRKLPRHKRREMRRRMKQVRAKVDTRGIARAPKARSVLDQMVSSAPSVERAPTAFERPPLEPALGEAKISIQRKFQRGFDLSTELMDVRSLDTGQYLGAVVQDPNDKRKVKGFIYIAKVLVQGQTYLPGWRTGPHQKGLGGSIKLIQHLAEVVNDLTDVKVMPYPDTPIGSDDLFKIPWTVFGPNFAFEATQIEKSNLGQYLRMGGFMVVDVGVVTYGVTEGFIRDALATTGLREGREWVLEPIPNDHPLYHVYYDFDGPPLTYATAITGDVAGDRSQLTEVLSDRARLDGVFIDGRLTLVYSTIGITNWSRPYYFYADSRKAQPQYQQFGANLIIFAMTQEGGLAQRLIRAQ